MNWRGSGRAPRGCRDADASTRATAESYGGIARSRGGRRPSAVTIVRNAPPRSWIEMPVRARPGVLAQVEIVCVGAISDQDGVDGLAPVLAELNAPETGIEAHL